MPENIKKIYKIIGTVIEIQKSSKKIYKIILSFGKMFKKYLK